MWVDYFDKIIVISLPEREDRLQDVVELLNKYEIPFFVFEAIKHDKGALGLAATMKALFTNCIMLGYERILVFEDDIDFVVPCGTFHETMEKCVDGLKSTGWGLFYPGVQLSRPFVSRLTENLFRLAGGYSTHAVAYSREAMTFFVNANVMEPIDNFLVREFQPRYPCYAAYPLLATQKTNFSDICKEEVNWDRYITGNYEKFYLEYKRRHGI